MYNCTILRVMVATMLTFFSSSQTLEFLIRNLLWNRQTLVRQKTFSKSKIIESTFKTSRLCWTWWPQRPLRPISHIIEDIHSWIEPPGGGTVFRRGWSSVAAELAELAFVNQVDQLTHQVDDVTTDQLMTTPYFTILIPKIA